MIFIFFGLDQRLETREIWKKTHKVVGVEYFQISQQICQQGKQRWWVRDRYIWYSWPKNSMWNSCCEYFQQRHGQRVNCEDRGRSTNWNYLTCNSCNLKNSSGKKVPRKSKKGWQQQDNKLVWKWTGCGKGAEVKIGKDFLCWRSTSKHKW